MQLIQHYIITRFNLPMFDKLRNGSKVNICDEDYLSARLDIFEKYTLPSIRNQSNQNFKWLVMFDSETPQSIKLRLQKLESAYTNLVVCYIDCGKYDKNLFPDKYRTEFEKYSSAAGIDGFDNMKQSSYMQSFVIPHYLKSLIASFNAESKYIVTTRIDNDDMFHPRMIDDIQRRIALDDACCMYNYSWGYQVLLNERIAQKYIVIQNHFTTLVESSQNFFYSAFYWDHRYVKQFNDYREIECDPLWVELVHESNVSNNMRDFNSRDIIFSNKVFSDFPMLGGFRINVLKSLIVISKNTFPINFIIRVIKHYQRVLTTKK